jgi:hypothetical protein
MYTYRVSARWPDGKRCEREVVFRGGEEISVMLSPQSASAAEKPAQPTANDPSSASQRHQEPAPELLNFGLDVQRLQGRPGRDSGHERFIWRGREITRAEALALISGQVPQATPSGRTVPDDSHLPHLTIVSRDVELRRRIVRDLETAPELAPWRNQFRVQSYPADHWIVPRLALDRDREFAASGLAIIVQPPAGQQQPNAVRICYRYEGPAQLADWLRQDKPRTPSGLSLPSWAYLALFATAAWLVYRTHHQAPISAARISGGHTMHWLTGYKTYLAALLAAFVAFNHVVPVVSPEVEQAILAAAAALGLYGLRHALERLEQRQPSNPS